MQGPVRNTLRCIVLEKSEEGMELRAEVFEYYLLFYMNVMDNIRG